MHPQIAAFARLAGENTPPVRVLEGQKTLISRTMHGFAYDAIHDEIVVTSPLAQAILTFRLTGYDPLGIAIDPVHKEIMFSAAANERTVRPPTGIMNTVITFSWPEIF
jgi:hypothetical protein